MPLLIIRQPPASVAIIASTAVGIVSDLVTRRTPQNVLLPQSLLWRRPFSKRDHEFLAFSVSHHDELHLGARSDRCNGVPQVIARWDLLAIELDNDILFLQKMSSVRG